MKIGLIGYGKMGKTIEQIALQRGHQIAFTINSKNNQQLPQLLKNCHVAIEFSRPETVVNNIKACFNAKIPVVVGTTGWNNHFESLKTLCQNQKGTLFYASNFSIGVNLIFEINKQLAKLMNKFSDYEVTLKEIHHIHKLDAPSGTAITLAQQIIENLDRKKQWKLTEQNPTVSDLSIEALRENEVPGTHIVSYKNTIDEIIISHEAKNRTGFALGAVLAAEFVETKTGIFNMNDLLNL